MAPPLGWITPSLRTNDQNDAHAAAVKKMPRFALASQDLAAGEMIILSDFWGKPEVIADIGITFDRSPFHQVTGSCVGAGGGNALFTLGCVQRLNPDKPTKAFVPWWPFSYGRCRYNEGDRGRGEGAMGSSFAETIVKEGVIDTKEPGLPSFQQADGLMLSESQEMDWSDGGSSLVTAHLPAAKIHPMGSAAPLTTTDGMKTAIINGYPGSFACDRYIGNASMQGSGENAAVCGRWDSNGGHQQWFFGYWQNPTLGPLFAIGNNWPRSTYPKDAHLPMVCCWVKETDVARAFGYNSEVYAFSHQAWIEAQPFVVNWLM